MCYENACIYKLCCNDKNITDVYVGSTTNFVKRKRLHKITCNNENSKNHNLKVYKFIRDNSGWDNWSMEIIEEVKVNNKNELQKLERKYMEELNCTLNCVIPTRTIKEWYEDNKEKRKEYFKVYRQNNKEKINEKDKRWYENNQEKVKEYNKEWYQNNQEKINENNKKNYEKNKKEINEKRKVKIECECCKSIVRKSNIRKHQKSKKCMDTQTM